MNLKQAQAILSDLLMKCEEENVDLPPVRCLTLSCIVVTPTCVSYSHRLGVL